MLSAFDLQKNLQEGYAMNIKNVKSVIIMTEISTKNVRTA